MQSPTFYFDYAATSPVLPEALETALPFLQLNFGNPSSLHELGVNAAKAVRQSRRYLGELMGVKAEQVVYTSCGTEANNLAMMGVCLANIGKGKQVIISALEHDSVRNAALALGKLGFQVDTIKITREGIVDVQHLAELLSAETRLVSVMAVNNEIGTAQPLKEIGELIKSRYPRVIYHVDGVQALTKLEISLKENLIDLFSISGHKLGAPKGIGVLFMSRAFELFSLMNGGGQEHGLRSGTENVFGIVALSKALQVGMQDFPQNLAKYQCLRAQFVAYLAAQKTPLRILEPPTIIPQFLNFAVAKLPAEVLLHHFEAAGICVSTGSACASKKKAPSPTLLALQLEPQWLNSLVRLSFGPQNLQVPWAEIQTRLDQVFASLPK